MRKTFEVNVPEFSSTRNVVADEQNKAVVDRLSDVTVLSEVILGAHLGINEARCPLHEEWLNDGAVREQLTRIQERVTRYLIGAPVGSIDSPNREMSRAPEVPPPGRAF